MKQQPTIKMLPQKKLIGKSTRMSLIENSTPLLWRSFMQNRKTVKNSIGTDLYSIQVYDDTSYFKNFNPQTEFTKFAMTEVTDFDVIPDEMETLTIASGLYAVFIYKGLPQGFPALANYIFAEWLPNSDYELDNRPHFEVLPESYNPMDENSQEEVWIPIKE
ncbi:GyrI-like domain-containing protein [Kordia sp. YSTF-M3]|uniref:GyrI-like domain-containing protein n=1 Tax=Kordia aestuariivivens TaxID=2759037 RepID=A0ABR7Q7N6_9FLAO|nr:GyrI-like domain-containing protein [Kordia aestuariivivens]MBC8754591.1 GyrI-like domain-containing protein [Kordia aestuariivivens]